MDDCPREVSTNSGDKLSRAVLQVGLMIGRGSAVTLAVAGSTERSRDLNNEQDVMPDEVTVSNGDALQRGND